MVRGKDPWWTGRSTIELMVLIMTLTVCGALLLAGAAIVTVELLNPEADTSAVINNMSDILSTILGGLLGLLAGRSDQGHKRPDGTTDEL